MKLEISKYRNIEISRRRGFALLIAVIISTIILTISISIVNTAIKEVILASTVRNSLASFYIADSGAECALYWDNIRGNFGKASAFVLGSPISRIECGGVQIPNVGGSHVEFWIQDATRATAPCAQVTIDARPGLGNAESVLIDSWGFNTCDAGSQRRVDRALEVKYSRFK